MLDLSTGPDGEPILRELSEEEAEAILVPPPRRLLPKSTVTGRLIAMGKAAQVKAGLDADPVAWARWFTPDWPNVYADDEGLVAFLEGLGLTPAEIDTVTAP